jgi:LPS export ABC transporter protein LptC
MDRLIFISGIKISKYLLIFPLLLASCSFDYSDQTGSDKNLPDIIMENVEYVRVRSADPQARLQAERVERYEERRIMELRNFSFEQFGNHGEEVNAYGMAGSASFEIDSGDIRMDNGVRIDVDSEELAIETRRLEWKDKDRLLTAGDQDEVNIYQENGTAFTGIGFHADARRRTWEFAGNVSGAYVYDDVEEESAAEEDDATTEEEMSANPDDAKPAADGIDQ